MSQQQDLKGKNAIVTGGGKVSHHSWQAGTHLCNGTVVGRRSCNDGRTFSTTHIFHSSA